jgi:ABC-type transport system substrate-binding protein
MSKNNRLSRRDFIRIAATGSAGLVVLSACKSAATPTEVPPTDVPPPEPTAGVEPGFMVASDHANAKYGGTMRDAGMQVTVPHYDLHQGIVGIPLVPMYDNLVAWNMTDGGWTQIPALAKSWDISPDGLQYTFHLRENVKFHDGTPFSADDVMATYNRILDPPEGFTSPYTEAFAPVTTLDKVDNMTVRFTLKQPYFLFMDHVASDFGGVIYPKKWLDQYNQDVREVLVPGTGPWVLKEERQEEFWSYTKNKEYWNPYLPYCDELVMLSTPANDERGTAVLTDQADFTNAGGMNSHAEGANHPDVVTLNDTTPNPTRAGLLFNCTKAPFDDPRVRRAFLLVRNVDEWAEIFNQHQRMVVSHWVPKGDPLGIPEDEWRKLPGYGTDKTDDNEMAKQLMKDAGYENGIEELDVVAWKDHPTYYVIQAYQQTLKDVLNVTINIRAVDYAMSAQELASGNFQAWNGFYYAGGPVDYGNYASFFYKSTSPSNSGKWVNKEFDAKIDQYMGELDADKRVPIIREAVSILDEDPPVLLCGTEMMLSMWRNNVHGLALEKRRTWTPKGTEIGWKA